MEAAMSQAAMSRTPSGGIYLPHPYPVKRLGTMGGHNSGFKSMQDPDHLRHTYQSYGAWFEAQQPPPGPLAPKVDRKATSYWPFGPATSHLVGSDDKGHGYWLDGRWVDNQRPHKGTNHSPSMSWTRDSRAEPMPRRSTSHLFGSTAEQSILKHGTVSRLGAPREQQLAQLRAAHATPFSPKHSNGQQQPSSRGSNDQQQLMPEWRVPTAASSASGGM
eukprot:TRINITY_DN94496_c0_g1_i1.p1 TRINITY_DN94496_c0_g1~~TRINITY_DN94496_c0_g1_i1.p1  ORF type:complete len:218 (+),score=39.42 TRINITY_DN94496_c0_g1_i1:172-825(+)